MNYVIEQRKSLKIRPRRARQGREVDGVSHIPLIHGDGECFVGARWVYSRDRSIAIGDKLIVGEIPGEVVATKEFIPVGTMVGFAMSKLKGRRCFVHVDPR